MVLAGGGACLTALASPLFPATRANRPLEKQGRFPSPRSQRRQRYRSTFAFTHRLHCLPFPTSKDQFFFIMFSSALSIALGRKQKVLFSCKSVFVQLSYLAPISPRETLSILNVFPLVRHLFQLYIWYALGLQVTVKIEGWDDNDVWCTWTASFP